MKKKLYNFDDFVIFCSRWNINTENKQFVETLFSVFRQQDLSLIRPSILKSGLVKSKNFIQYAYWTERGWSQEFAKSKVGELQSKRSLSYKKLLDRGCTAEQAKTRMSQMDSKRTETMKSSGNYEEICKSRGNGNRWEYYLDKINPTTNFLYTEQEARAKVSTKQRKFFDRMWISIKEEDGEFVNNTSVEYFIRKGFSPEEAKKELKNRQSTFSLEKCIEKHGLEEGTLLWQDRQNRWQETLNKKSDEEKHEINVRRFANRKSYSTVSVNLFEDVIIELKSKGIELTYYMKEQEFHLYDTENKKSYFYDLCVTIKPYNRISRYFVSSSPIYTRRRFTKMDLPNHQIEWRR